MTSRIERGNHEHDLDDGGFADRRSLDGENLLTEFPGLPDGSADWETVGAWRKWPKKTTTIARAKAAVSKSRSAKRKGSPESSPKGLAGAMLVS